MTKKITVEKGACVVEEQLPDNPNGTKSGRGWSFSTLAEAQKQRAEFDVDLNTAPNAAAKAALNAHAAALAAAAEDL